MVGVDAHKRSFSYVLLGTGTRLSGGVKTQGEFNTQAGYAPTGSGSSQASSALGRVTAVRMISQKKDVRAMLSGSWRT